MRGWCPLPAIKIPLLLRIEMIIGVRIPGAERRVVIAYTRHKVIVGVDVFGADR